MSQKELLKEAKLVLKNSYSPWFERKGTGVDVAALHKQYPEVNWLTFKDWVKSQNWGDLAEHSIK